MVALIRRVKTSEYCAITLSYPRLGLGLLSLRGILGIGWVIGSGGKDVFIEVLRWGLDFKLVLS